MSNFSAKNVKRAIRDFDSAVMDLMDSDYETYKVRVKSLFNLINHNEIINFIVGPLLKIEVDFDEIYKNGNGFWIFELNLPEELNDQLAYVLQVLESVANGSNELENISHRIFKEKKIGANIQLWLSNVAQSCFRELSYKLNDLIEDEVEGRDTIMDTSLKIFNYGSITATQGSNVAIGKDISQTVTYKNIVKEILEKVKNEGLVSEDKSVEVEEAAKEIEEEINKAEPSPSKLKQLAQKVYSIGETGLLKAFSTVVKDPRWGQAVADTLMSIY